MDAYKAEFFTFDSTEQEPEAALLDIDELAKELDEKLDEELDGLAFLEEERAQIGNPENLGSTVATIVWEQFINQVGVIAGEDFIKENRGLTLDLRDDAHIQMTDDFAKGKIATHNDKIDYQERFDRWQEKFQKDESGKVKTAIDPHTKQEKAILTPDARAVFDKNRPKGSGSMAMDHTMPVAEIIRDPAANAHLSEEQQIAFANSAKNLNPLDSAANQSKSDRAMSEWLDSERDGQKPADRFNIDEKQLREKDAEARKEYEKVIKEGEETSIKAGKQSQKEEAFRISGKALRAVLMGLLVELMRDIIGKLVLWMRSAQKSLETFIGHIKEAILCFVKGLKRNIMTAGDTLVTTIATAIVGPIVGTIKKAWILLKQGGRSLKEAIDYIKRPENQKKSFPVLLLEIGKIAVAGLSAAGAIVLSETIEKGLMTVPIFAVEIPALGSLANIIGIFGGAVVSGILGALAINLIDKVIAEKQRTENTKEQIDKGNEILQIQAVRVTVKTEKLNRKKGEVLQTIVERHDEARKKVEGALCTIYRDDEDDINERLERMDDDLDALLE